MRFPYFSRFAVIGIILTLLISSFIFPASGETLDERQVDTASKETDSATADTMIVKGQVLDRITQLVVPGSTLVFHNDLEKYRAVTDERGSFAIELPSGKFMVIVQAEGYNELHDEVAGRPDQVVEVRYALVPIDAERPPEERPPPPPPDEEPPDEDIFRYQENERDYVIRKDLGGGESIVFRTGGTGAHIAVIFGTREQPNFISIVAFYDRYVGAGDLYDDNGVLVAKNEPIIFNTIFKQSFLHLIEYNDTNKDGLWKNPSIPLFADPDNFAIVSLNEFPSKVVSLRTAWQRSEISENSYRNGIKEFSFTLTARDLPYVSPIEPDRIVSRSSLDVVKFTFHIILTKDEVTRDDIPVFKIDVRTEDEVVKEYKSSSFDEYRSYSGSRISSKVKYDYSIGGWDYDRTSTEPRLFFDLSNSILHSPGSKLARWMAENTDDKKELFNEKMRYSDPLGNNKELYIESDDETNRYELVENTDVDTGDEKYTATRGADPAASEPEETSEPLVWPLKMYETPETVNNDKIDFVDKLYKTGVFSWVNNVTADGNEVRIKFQVQRISWIKHEIDGRVYSGMHISGGFNLPGAIRIHHDPTVANEIFELSIEAEDVQGRPVETDGILFSASMLLIIVLLIFIAFYGMVNNKADRKMKPPKIPESIPPPPMPKRSVMDRDTYKKKKSEDEEYYESYMVDWED